MISRALVAALTVGTAVSLLGPTAAPASAAVTCSYTAPTVTVALGASDTATVKRGANGLILVNGAACGTASVATTDTVRATGSNGGETVNIDLSGGPFEPGFTAEASGKSEVEFEVNLAASGTFTPDTVSILGTGGPDVVRLGSAGVNVNGDDDADVTGSAGGSLASMSAERLSASTLGGADTISGTGAVGGTTAPIPFGFETRLDGGGGNDSIAGGYSDDVLIGGTGADIESGDDGDDTFLADAAANGADDISGGAGPDDAIDYSGRNFAISVTLDDVANDGALGELDNIRSDVERFALGSADDTFLDNSGAFQSRKIAGGPGADTLTGGGAYDQIYGCMAEGEAAFASCSADSSDTIHAGNGSDEIYGQKGNDSEYGDAGQDVFYEDGAVNGSDGIFGGADSDTVFYEYRDTPHAVSLFDNAANDGEDSDQNGVGEEADNVHSDVENVDGSKGPNRITGSSADNTLTGRTRPDQIKGLGGNDTITLYGTDPDLDAARDQAWGGPGDDYILAGFTGAFLFGEDGADYLYGGSGDDFLDGGLGADYLTGGGGEVDTVSYSSRGIGLTVTLDGVTANDGQDSNGDGVAEEGDTVGADVENVQGGNGPDRITAQTTAVNNRFEGNGGQDVLKTDAGDDLLDGGLGGDQLNGGAGADTVTYAGRAGRVRVDIGGTGDGTDANNDGIAEEGDAVAADVEHLIGGNGNDSLVGSAASNKLWGGSGNDSITGGDGTDELLGGAGNDALNGGDGNDVLSASDGNDTLTGGPGNDAEDGETGLDVFAMGPAPDGADTLTDATEPGVFDVVDYSQRSAAVKVTIDFVVDDGEPGEADYVSPGVEAARGGSAGDVLVGSPEDNQLFGNAGNDSLNGGSGADLIDGGAGVDGTSYADRTAHVSVATDLEGGDGEVGENDNVTSTVENVTGGSGSDYLQGSSAQNVLDGGPSTDWLNGGMGADILKGGDGIDYADYSTRTQSVRVTLDGLANDGKNVNLDAVSDENDLVSSDVENVNGGSAADWFVGDEGANELAGAAGDDHLYGNGENDRVAGGAGNDYLDGGAGNDAVAGGDGDDRISEGSVGPNGEDLLSGGSGDHDWISYDGRTAPVRINLASNLAREDGEIAANEQDSIGTDIEDAFGGEGADVIVGNVAANTLTGAPGNDSVLGQGGNDLLYGSAGNDVLDGGTGNDRLTGSIGSDQESGVDGDDTFDQEAEPNGADDLRGGAGDDTVDFSKRKTGVKITLNEQRDDGAQLENDLVRNTVENLAGGSGNDVISTFTTAGARATIWGNAGADALSGGSIVETFFGGAGDDVLSGGGNDDTLNGGTGDDELHGGSGGDVFNSSLAEALGSDHDFGEEGDDTFFEQDGSADTVDGGADTDTCTCDAIDTLLNIP